MKSEELTEITLRARASRQAIADDTGADLASQTAASKLVDIVQCLTLEIDYLAAELRRSEEQREKERKRIRDQVDALDVAMTSWGAAQDHEAEAALGRVRDAMRAIRSCSGVTTWRHVVADALEHVAPYLADEQRRAADQYHEELERERRWEMDERFGVDG